MTVSYRNLGQHVQLPVLHKVVYAQTTDDVQAQYQHSYKDYMVNRWLEDNCKRPYYHSPGYMKEKFIQFECSEDAMLFALRWS